MADDEIKQRMRRAYSGWPCLAGDHDNCVGQAQLSRTGPLDYCRCSCHEATTQALATKGAKLNDEHDTDIDSY